MGGRGAAVSRKAFPSSFKTFPFPPMVAIVTLVALLRPVAIEIFPCYNFRIESAFSEWILLKWGHWWVSNQGQLEGSTDVLAGKRWGHQKWQTTFVHDMINRSGWITSWCNKKCMEDIMMSWTKWCPPPPLSHRDIHYNHSVMLQDLDGTLLKKSISCLFSVSFVHKCGPWL